MHKIYDRFNRRVCQGKADTNLRRREMDKEESQKILFGFFFIVAILSLLVLATWVNANSGTFP